LFFRSQSAKNIHPEFFLPRESPVSYVSLARKYRPRRFEDMVGQESTTLALTNAIRLRREPHSVIFTGVRGVGKTTSARIYAKALNCEKGPTAEPCDVCASCLAIVAGNHEDVLEIDGASNTGVDDVRALQETLSYVPQRSTYKIYIIDEVHMLSISAFNALLKTLEEPPQHVVFIFATTELHKVPETIQSRCQTFHLQKISRPVIADRVRSILSSEDIPFEEAALAIVAREGRGSMRDALTMLDQAIAVGGGQVSLEALRNMVGSSSQALPVLELLDGLLRKDARQILEVIARWDQEGLAMSSLVEETAKACRNAFILRDLKGQAIDLQLLELEDREQQMLLELGEKAAPMDLNRLFRQLAKCLDDLRHADLDRFVLENYCLEWCFDPGLPDLQALMNIISSGQPMPQIPAKPIVPQAAPSTEGPAINLRERWKTSAPTAPAARPAAPQTPAPQASPAPAMKPGPAPMGKPAAPQAQLDKPMTPTAGSGPAPTAAPAMTTPQNHGMSNLVQKLAMAQAPQSGPVAQTQAAVNPAPLRPAPHVQSQPRPNPEGQATPSPAALNPLAARVSAQNQARAEGQMQGAPVNSAAQPSADPANSRSNGLVESIIKPAFPKVPPASNPAAALTPARSGAQGKPNSSAVPPEPMPPPDWSDDDVPPWVLQDEEATRQGAFAAVAEEPVMPEPPKNDGFLKQMAHKAAAEVQAAPAEEPLMPEPPKSEGFLKQMARKAAAEIQAAPPKVENVAAPVEPAATVITEVVWPENWRAFVEEWKKQKPLQGRILEEAYLLEYSPQRIRLAVEPTSMGGAKLLQQDVRKRLMEQFAQLFGFKGVLDAVAKADAHPGKSGTAAPDLGETLLDVKNREREIAREQLRHRLEEHPMTREVISRFGGTIEQIELQ
jgi:DNA polymerase-3 subunit gamma/tau